MASTKMILTKSKDWDTWISYIQMRAGLYHVWPLIDPNSPVKVPHLVKPSAPMRPIPTPNQPVDSNVLTLYEINCELHEFMLSKYEKQQAGFREITKYIRNTISPANAIYIKKIEPHPYDILVALKKKLAPSDETRSLWIKTEYHNLCKGPQNQEIYEWLDKWYECCDRAKEYGIGELSGYRSIRDFLFAAKKIDPAYADFQLTMMACSSTVMDVFDIIENFRHLIGLNHGYGKRYSQFAFRVEEASKEENKKASFRGREIEPSECICGKKHWYSNCFYLNPRKRPSGWKADSQVQKKVENAMKNSSLKAKVERALKKNRDIENKKKKPEEKKSEGGRGNNSSTTAKSPKLESVLSVIDESNYSSSRHSLRSSWILSYASTIHVCNDTMKHRFVKEKDGGGQCIIAGTQEVPVVAYGHIRIEHEGERGTKGMTLTNVAYIPDFITNYVSGHILRMKGVHLNTESGRLHRHGSTYGYAQRKFRLYLMEDNTEASFEDRW